MPIYNLNNRKFNIPDEVVNDFERDNPDATIAYNANGNIYDIPVNKKQGFLQKYPNATLYDDVPQINGEVVNNTISGGVGTQEEADSLFELNAARFNEKDPNKRAALDMQYNQLEDSLKKKQGQQLRNHLENSGEIRRLQEVQGKAQLEIDKSSFFDRFFNAETRAAVAARDAAEEALETYSEANQKNDGWFDKNVGGALRGFFDKVGDLRTWDFGASGVSSAVALKDASEKLERGEALTPAEQNMLDAYGLSAAVQAAYQDKVGTAYRVGGSLPESLAFGASLALNPAGGVGKKIAETAAKAAVKKYGTGLVSKLAKGAARVGGDIVEMGVATAIPGAGRVAEDYYNRLNGQSTFDVDNNGIIRYGGQVDQEEADDAIWKAFGSQFIENYSESMGNYFAPMGTMLSNLTSKGLKAGGLGKLAEAVSDISSSQWSKGLQRFKDAVKFDGLVGEYLEEVAGNFMNAATVGDMNFNSPEDPNSVFNPDTNIETFLSCALLSGTMYAVEAPITLYNKHTAKKNLRNADNTASSLLGNRWEDLRNQIDSASPEHLAQILTGVQNAEDFNDEQKQAVKLYASRLMQSQGFNARNVQNAQETTTETNEAQNAYNEGSENDAPQYVFKANRERVKAGNALKAVDENVASVIDTALETGESIEPFLNGLDENVANLARDYYNKSLRMRGVIDGVMDRAEDAIAEEEKIIRSVTDPSTGMYTEINRLVTNPQTGEREAQPGYVVGWIGDGENRMPTFLPEGVENIPENRIPLKPTEFDKESIERLPMDDVISINAEMIRERAKKDLNDKASMAEQVYNYVPKNEDQVIGADGQVLTITGVTPDGIVYISEQGNVNQMSLDEWKGLMQAQLDAQEQIAAEEQAAAPEVVEEVQPTEEAVVKENFTTETGNNLSPVEEVAQPQAPVIPTKEDGSIDFVSYGKEGTFKTLGEKYGEKMPNKVAVTAKALAEDLKKAQDKLQKAEEAYDNAPIGREQKAEEVRDKAKQELEAIQREANFWAEMDAEIKDAQARRESMLNPQAEVETSTEPMNVDEFVAQQLASGNIVLDKEDYKKETGYGDTEANAMNGGATKLFGKNGMTIQEAGERLMEIDRENGTNFFNQLDSNSGRDALINVLGSVKSRKELNQYIATNRAEQAKRESEGLRNELEKQAMEANYASLEDYVLQMEVEEMENPFLNDRADEIMAIFAEEAAKYEQSLNNTENGQGTENEVVEGNDSILPEEQLDNTGRTEVSEESERIGDGTSEESESTHAATEVELKQEEGETTLQFAERAAEENRRRPLRKRAEEWSNTLGVKVTYLESIDDVDAKTRSQIEAAHAKGSSVPGWVNKKGEVFFFMPDLSDLKDVDDTYIHEVVAHVGLPQLLGKERFGELCDKVWEMMPQSAKDYYMSYPGVKNHRDAADEYIAHLAEQQNLTPEERTIWDNIVKMFREMLDKALNGIISKSKLTDEDISNLIKASYANLKSGAEGSAESSTRFKVYKSKDGKETKYKQLSLFGEGNETTDDRTRPNNLQREGDSTIERLNHLRELQEGEICNVERKFTESKEFSFTRGEKVESTADVAYIFKSLEDEAVENSFVAITNGDNVSVFHLGMGAQTETVVDTSAILAAVDRLDADKVFFVHNHPSGMVKCSRQDILTYQKLKDRLGDKLQDGIIINTRSGKYGLFNSSGLVDDEGRIKEEKNEYPLKVYKFNKQSFNVDVIPTVEASSSGIAEFVSTQRLGKRDKVNALLLNNQFGCVGNILIDNSKNMSYVAERITNDAIAMGARKVVIYGRYPFVEVTDRKTNFASYLSSMINGFSQGNVNLIDIIQIDEPYSKSANDEGVRFRAKFTPEEQTIIKKAKTDGSYMKSPNGKPTNLTEKQWAQVRTKAFKTWFGDWEKNPKKSSLMIDENGEPKVFYHGSPSRFNEFISDKMGETGTGYGQGFYFSPEKWFAEGYVGVNGGTLYEVFLNLRKPISDTKKTLKKPSIKRFIDEIDKRMMKRDDDGIGILDNWNDVSYYGRNKVLNEATEAVFEYNGTDLEIVGDLINTTGSYDIVTEVLRDVLGFDGILPSNTDNEVIVHHPNQIKSATDNVGTFDSSNNDIRFRFIGERGARNLDKAEEATTRLDNLAVAREMEAAEKDAKTIKMATGWERGADGLWRYEVDDNIDFELRRPKKAELKKAYEEANEKYYKLEMRVPTRTPKNATEDEKQRIKDMRKELAKLRKGMNKAFDAYYDYSAESATLGEFLGKDNQLFKEYPELADYDLSFLRDSKKLAEGLKGSFAPEYKVIWVDDARPKGDIKSTLVHEIQHAIQAIEGFAQGGTPAAFASSKYQAEEWKANFNEFINRYGFEDWSKNLPIEDWMKYGKEYKGQFGGLHRAFIDNAVEDDDVKKTLTKELDYVKTAYDKFYQIAGGMDPAYKFKDANEWYRSLSGEVESRNVQQRMGMTDDQRRNSLASETEDVAREDQIFLKDGIESGMRFRLSEKGKQIQAEADKFTSKYASRPVLLVENSMSDEEKIKLFDNLVDLETIHEWLNVKKAKACIVKDNGKIYIFADNISPDDVELSMFHENLHAFIADYRGLMDKVWERMKDIPSERLTHIKEKYKEEKWKEEFFVYTISLAQKVGYLGEVKPHLDEAEMNELIGLLNKYGYDYEKEYDERRRARASKLDGQGRSEDRGRVRTTGSGTEGLLRESGQEERKARLNELFNKVADMGLQGVLGNKEYTSLMVDIYKALPEGVRAEIAEDALRLYGGSVAPAVSDYIGPKSKNSIMDKVVTIVREALRKVGFDLDLNANEVRYMAWRSKKPLDRNNMLEVAEDIDMKYRLKVGEYDGTTPDGGGTRFRAKEPEKIDIADKRSPIIKKYDETLKTGMFNFQEAFQDRMLSLKVLMDVIVGATGKKAKSFEDAYEAENQLSSTNKVDQERYIKKFYTPLVEYLKEISKKHGEEIVRRYIYCKSGLERNEVLRQRDADEAFNAAKEELDEKLSKKEITQSQYDALLQQAEDQRAKTLSEDVDYSGIRGMLFNVRSQELFEQYQSGTLTEAQYKQKIEELKNKKADVVKNWKDFAIISVADLESRATSAELDELWSKINAATNETLRIDFESGMIDRETYEAEKNMMKYYVPLRDWENTKAEEMYEYRHDMTPAVSSNQKKAKGRESEAANPMATIALMAQNAIVRGNRNKMKQKLYSFVVNRPNDLASVRNVWYVRDANNQWEPQYANTSAASNQEEANQIIEQFEANMEVLAAQGDAFKGKLKQGMGYRASRKQKDEHVVAVMINGKEYGVYINGNPRAAQAVNGLTNAENVDDGYAWIDNLKRLYGGGLTSWNPDFIIPNFVRDTIHASTMTFLDRGVLGSVQYMANIPKIFAQVSAEVSGLSTGNAKLHQYFEEFVNNGGETGYTEVHTLEDYKKEYQKLMNEAKGLKAGIKKGMKLPFEKIANVLEAANRIAEDVNRFNAYVTSREAGENIVSSISAAKNITVNFNRKGALHANSSVYGKVASFMSRWILFFNPSVQGIYQLVSKSKMNPKRATALGATIIASGFFMPLLNEMLVSAFGGGDEDDYWNQSDFKRRNNWMLFTGDGYVSIPLPPVFREIYGMGDIIYGVMTGHIPSQRAIYDVLNQVQSAIGFVTLLPEVSQEPDVTTWLKGFAPDLASPFLDVMSNTNFMGRPIAKWTDYNETDPEYERVYKGVGKHWVAISELMNEIGGNKTRRSDWWGNMINPAMMEHLVTSYTGGIGKTINNFIGMTIDAVEGDKENMDVFRKAPIVPRFYTPNDEKTVYPGINRKFYEFEYQYNNAKKSLKKSQDGVNSGEHPEWQKYIDEMDKNGEKKFIEYFKKEQKKLKKLQDKLKEDPNNKEVEKKVYDKKAEISAESFKILSGQK